MPRRDQNSTQYIHIINIFNFYPSRVNDISRERPVRTFFERIGAMNWYLFVNIQRVTSSSSANRLEVFTFGGVVFIGAILIARHYFARRWIPRVSWSNSRCNISLSPCQSSSVILPSRPLSVPVECLGSSERISPFGDLGFVSATRLCFIN